jgi:DNA-binding beta-propeller fold protein YncE
MMFLRSRSNWTLSLLLLSLCAGACGGGSKLPGDGSPPSSSDTTPPTTSANPIGGLYPAYQFVTLTADEAATIYYTTDGFTPQVGGTTTFSGPSPIQDIAIDHPLSLKFFAVDAAGNQETVKTWIYTFDLDPPSILISNFLTGTYGFLEVVDVEFTSDESGSWGVEIGGTGEPGSGINVNTGFLAAFQPVSVPLSIWRLAINAQNPGNSVWAWVKDQAGGLGSYEFEVKTMADEAFAAPGLSTDLELTPDGNFGYLLRPTIAQVWKFDSAPLSATFNQFVEFITVGANPTGMDLTPDGARLYVAHDGGFSEVDVATSFVTPIALPGGRTPSGIAIQPDELEALAAAQDGSFWRLDVDPLSPNFRSAVQLVFSEPSLEAAQITLSPGAERAIITWTGAGLLGVQVLDTDPLSPGYLTPPSELIEALLPATVASPVVNAAATRAWIGNADGKLQRVLLDAVPPSLANASFALVARGLTLTPDEKYLILSGSTLNGLRFVDPVSLLSLHFAPAGGLSGSGTGRELRYSPDGKRLYLVRDNDSASGELWMLWLTSE